MNSCLQTPESIGLRHEKLSMVTLIPGDLAISQAGTSQFLIQFGLAPTTVQAGSPVLRSHLPVAIILRARYLMLRKLLRACRNRHLVAVPAATKSLAVEAVMAAK
jgi:hypothetical protein